MRAETAKEVAGPSWTPSSTRLWLTFLLLGTIWGSSYLWIRLAVRQLSPLSLVSLRLLAGSIVIVAVAAFLQQNLRISRQAALHLVILATINTSLPFILISWGEITVPSGLASVLNSTVPIFAVLLAAAVLHDEPLTLSKTAAVAIGFGGVIVLLSEAPRHAAFTWNGVSAEGAIILASLCYAVGAVYTRRTLRSVPSLTIGTWILVISAVETTILMLIFSRPDLGGLTATTIAGVLWLGVLGSAFAYILSFFILAHWGASRYTLVVYLIPLVGLSLGVIFLGEALDWRLLAGSVMVVIAIVLAGNRQSVRRGRDLALRLKSGSRGIQALRNGFGGRRQG